MLNMFRMLVHALVRCVLVLRCGSAGWCGIHTVTPTHIELEQYNPWYNSTNKSQAPDDGCTKIRNLLSIK